MTATCNQAKDAPHRIAVILVDDTLMTENMKIAKAEELFCRPDQCSLTNSYVDNNSSLIRE
jgi:hypothetical protein